MPNPQDPSIMTDIRQSGTSGPPKPEIKRSGRFWRLTMSQWLNRPREELFAFFARCGSELAPIALEFLERFASILDLRLVVKKLLRRRHQGLHLGHRRPALPVIGLSQLSEANYGLSAGLVIAFTKRLFYGLW